MQVPFALASCRWCHDAATVPPRGWVGVHCAILHSSVIDGTHVVICQHLCNRTTTRSVPVSLSFDMYLPYSTACIQVRLRYAAMALGRRPAIYVRRPPGSQDLAKELGVSVLEWGQISRLKGRGGHSRRSDGAERVRSPGCCREPDVQMTSRWRSLQLRG